MLNQELQKIGLNEKEAATYLACLELGATTLLELSKKTKLNRVTLYSVIDKLIDKKLVSLSIKGSKKIYIAEPPTKIQEILKERLNTYAIILPELISLTNKKRAQPKIKYLEGVDGIKEAYKLSLDANEATIKGICGVETLTQESKALSSFWEREYIPKRMEKKKLAKLVVPDNEMGQNFKKTDELAYRQTKLLPANFYNFGCELFVYDQITTTISYSQGEEFALIIDSKPVSETIKMIWQICWSSAR